MRVRISKSKNAIEEPQENFATLHGELCIAVMPEVKVISRYSE